MHNQDLLIEIGTEELPPKALLNLSVAFEKSISDQLQAADLGFTSIKRFATPRRLALLVSSLSTRQPDQHIEKTGPALQAAFQEDGTPTKAAEGFARSCGVSVTELQQKQDGKVTKLMHSVVKPGASTQELIPPMVSTALGQLPIPKRMRWGSSREEFVRPVHWCVLLFGSDIIPATILGVKAASSTYGHRFHSPAAITIAQPEDYETLLETTGFVVPDFEKRKSQIRLQLIEQGEKLKARTIIDEDLLNEVTSLVELPVALAGSFDKSFLDVPKEALISSMKEHQKCFHLLDSSDQILPYFITVSNIQSTDPEKVIAGNERVIRPRLADAAFFYNQDKKHTLESRQEKLKAVVFQQQLGTVFDKSLRVASLAEFIATELQFDVTLAVRAALLGKCDLVSSMVYEFAELQGVMGYYYALNDGEPVEVAQALTEQYLPKFSGDEVPQSHTGMVLALAERLDTITGLFSIGQPPSGSKDPFALRRAALGVLRIIVENSLSLDLDRALNFAVNQFKIDEADTVKTQIQDFIFDRFKTWYLDAGISTDIFISVASVRPTGPLDFNTRILAVNTFSALPQALALAAANKRVSNLLGKADISHTATFDQSLLVETAEIKLANELAATKTLVTPLLDSKQYSEALTAMASLQPSVDAFFEEVMVNADDPAIKHNRLALLQQLRNLFLLIADISHLQNV